MGRGLGFAMLLLGLAAAACATGTTTFESESPDAGPRTIGRRDAGNTGRVDETPTRDDDDGGPGPSRPEDAGPPRDAQTAACVDAGTADVALTGRGATVTRTLQFLGGTPKLPAFRAPSTCPAGDVFSTEERPFLAVRVRNDSGAPATLSAWAVCDAKTDAFLAFYRRSTPPTTEAERKDCALGTVLSNGTSFTIGDHSSPDTDPSVRDAGLTSYCPALLRANNVGLYLAPCETAVVFLQSFYASDDPSHSLPSALRLRLD